MSTIEAIQANLIGFGLILWPGSSEDPPTMIMDEDLARSEIRVFDKPNSKGPVFDYTYNMPRRVWELKDE